MVLDVASQHHLRICCDQINAFAAALAGTIRASTVDATGDHRSCNTASRRTDMCLPKQHDSHSNQPCFDLSTSVVFNRFQAENEFAFGDKRVAHNAVELHWRQHRFLSENEILFPAFCPSRPCKDCFICVENLRDVLRAAPSTAQRHLWIQMGLPFLYEIIADSIWRAIRWVCDQRPNAVIDSLKQVFRWRSSRWWRATIGSGTMKEMSGTKTPRTGLVMMIGSAKERTKLHQLTRQNL